MRTKIAVVPLLSVVLVATVIGLVIGKAESSPRIPQSPIIVGSVHMHAITQSIPTTTIFTPTATGLYRASFYFAMTTPNSSGNAWYLNLNWTDDAGPESTQLGYLNSGNIPPVDYEQNPWWQVGPTSPWVFEAVAGQPITFSLLTNGGPNPGTCGLAMTIERLQ